MALDPAHRYRTALELAHDVERHIADEPVSAYREPRLAKLARWTRHHRTAVRVATVSVCAMILLTLFSAVWLGGGVALSGFILASYTKKEYALRYGHKLPGGTVGKILQRDVRLFVLFLGALINRPFEAMVLIGLLSHFGVGWMLLTADRKQQRIQMTEEHPEPDLLRPKREAVEPAVRS